MTSEDQKTVVRSGVSRRETLYAAGFTLLGGCASAPAAQATTPARFTSGVASGDPTQTSGVIWTRALPDAPARAATVAFEIAEDPDFGNILRRGQATTTAERDFTVKIDVQGLQPGATYFYRFQAGAAQSPTGRTRTLPVAGAQSIRLALASCANYPSGFYNGYREIAGVADLDAVIHVGDYIYEYGPDGYDGETGKRIGRIPDPPHEIVTLDDYRRRFAQYRADPDLQAAHAHAPFITIWDDHETANNSWTGGADNHQEDAEGAWLARRDAALRAYFEWLPMRDPAPGAAAERLRRVYDFGDIASLIVIETRLTGRSRQLSLDETALADPQRFEEETLGDPSRTMMGPAQEAWLGEALMQSRARGMAWQILGNQTVMGRMRTPDFTTRFPRDVVDAAMAAGGYSARWLERSKLGLPVNLDSWDGYPAARTRLYEQALAADARLAVLSGDSHMFWANNLHHPESGQMVGVEFATAGITSPGGYENFGSDPQIFATAATGMAEHNPDIAWANVRNRGFVLLSVTEEAIEAEYVGLSTITERDYEPMTLLKARAETAPGRRELALDIG